MDIKTRFQTINDIDCKEYYIDIKAIKVNIRTEDRYNKFVSDDSEIKYLNLISSMIPNDETIMFKHSQVFVGYDDEDDIARFSVFTKRKKDLDEKENIREKVQNEMGVYLEDYDIDVNENYIKIDPRVRLTKNNLLKLQEILNSKDFEVIFDYHMETVYMIYYR